MKLPSGKHSYEILIVLIVLLLAVYAHAEEPGANSVVSSTSSGMGTADEATSTNSEDETLPTEPPPNLREEHRAQLERRFQDRIFNLTRNVSNRLEASIKRLQNISDRIDTRIVKLRNTGINTSVAEAKLAEARKILREAQSNFDALSSVQQALTSATPRESFGRIRTNFLATRDLLRKTHALLTETVIVLKNAPTESIVTATTSENTATPETVE